jgi:hypothetical protein
MLKRIKVLRMLASGVLVTLVPLLLKNIPINRLAPLSPMGQGVAAPEKLTIAKVVLDVSSFYQYRSPKMNSPSELCDWKTIR